VLTPKECRARVNVTAFSSAGEIYRRLERRRRAENALTTVGRDESRSAVRRVNNRESVRGVGRAVWRLKTTVARCSNIVADVCVLRGEDRERVPDGRTSSASAVSRCAAQNNTFLENALAARVRNSLRAARFAEPKASTKFSNNARVSRDDDSLATSMFRSKTCTTYVGFDVTFCLLYFYWLSMISRLAWFSKAAQT